MKEMNNIYKVPDGYFDSLQKRLEAIPSQHTEERAPVVAMPLWTRVRPYACSMYAHGVFHRELLPWTESGFRSGGVRPAGLLHG